MNTKEFVKALRAVIREEVRSAVREELKSVLTESKVKKQPTQSVQPRVQQTQKRSITGNPLLDQVLSETKLTSEFRQTADVGYEDFGSFTSNNVPVNTPSMMDMDIQEDYESPLPEMNPGMPFMKDYSQLMKKADQISQQKQF